MDKEKESLDVFIRIYARKKMLFCSFTCSPRHQSEDGCERIHHDLEVNDMNFYEWMLARYAGKDTPRGDLAEDMKHAGDFPDTSDRAVILNYLDGKFACDEAIAVFKRAFRDYRLGGCPVVTWENGTKQR